MKKITIYLICILIVLLSIFYIIKYNKLNKYGKFNEIILDDYKVFLGQIDIFKKINYLIILL